MDRAQTAQWLGVQHGALIGVVLEWRPKRCNFKGFCL
jgi:hypothetical protein